MKYSVTHITRYAYPEPVSVSHNQVCLRPRETPRQRLLKFTLDVDPVPEGLREHLDCDGNQLCNFTVRAAHDAMTLTAHSELVIADPGPPLSLETPPWTDARLLPEASRCFAAMEAWPFVFGSSYVPIAPVLADYAGASFTPGRPLLDAVLDFMARFHRDFTYDKTATEISTHMMDAFVSRRGVCQDFAHIVCGCLRALRLPARYVSGYLETKPPPGKEKLEGADATHAWVSVLCPGVGWIDFDPTNNVLAGTSHLTVAWGRDYGDVCPVRGVVRGGGTHALSVSVDVTPTP